jgi:1-deoxy-D-xylulose-5-phosphate reductoisomerase
VTPKGIAVLGATGSVGRSALAVIDRFPDRFRAVVLTANRNAEALSGLVAGCRPSLAVLAGEGADPPPTTRTTEWRTGRAALLEAVTHPEVDIVLNALVGAAGLEPTIAALEAGKRVALANKESLVSGGPLVLEAARRGGGELVPVDSEHSAVLQCIRGCGNAEVARIVLTASGGPFRAWTPERLATATPADALRHPTWQMGAKISIDSATLANKALEVIEAHFLFGLPYDRIEAVVHPQSIIHSMVEFVDGSVLAQMGLPSMELPIQYAFTFPERLADARRRWDPVAAGALTFEPVREGAFPIFRLGVDAGRAGGAAPAVFNAANEVAVAAFLRGAIPFAGIARAVETALAAWDGGAAATLDAVLVADAWARRLAETFVRSSPLC